MNLIQFIKHDNIFFFTNFNELTACQYLKLSLIDIRCILICGHALVIFIFTIKLYYPLLFVVKFVLSLFVYIQHRTWFCTRRHLLYYAGGNGSFSTIRFKFDKRRKQLVDSALFSI